MNTPSPQAPSQRHITEPMVAAWELGERDGFEGVPFLQGNLHSTAYERAAYAMGHAAGAAQNSMRAA